MAQLNLGVMYDNGRGVLADYVIAHIWYNIAAASDQLIDLLHSVDPAYRQGNATFMMNDSTLAAVRKLKDGDGNYLWQMGNYQAGVPQNPLVRML